MKKSVFEIFLNEGINENELEEALPGDLAKAYNNSGLNHQYRSSGYAPDYNATDYTEVSPAQAVEILKTNPTSLVAIVKDRSGKDRAVKFGSDGRTVNNDNYRFDVDDKYAYANKRGRNKGELRRDIHYIPAVHTLAVADKIYVTNEGSILKDPNKRTERAKNPESRYSPVRQKLFSKYANSSLIRGLMDLENGGGDTAINRISGTHSPEIKPGIDYNDGVVTNQYSYCTNGPLEQQLEKFKSNFAAWGWGDRDTRNSWEGYLLALQAGDRTYRNPTMAELKKLFTIDDSAMNARLRYFDVERILKEPIKKAKAAIGDVKELEYSINNAESNRTNFASPEQRASRENNITYYINRYKQQLMNVLTELERYETQLDDLDAADMKKLKDYDDIINDLQSKLDAARANLPQNQPRGSLFANSAFGNKVPESLELDEGKSIGEVADEELGIEHEDPLDKNESLTEDLHADKIKALARYLNIDIDDIEEVFDDDFDTPEGEYLVLTGSEAEARAKDEIKNSFDDMGLDAFTQEFKNWIVNNAIADSVIDNFIDQEIDYFTTQEDDEETLNVLKALNTREDKINYIENVFGDLNDFIKPENIDLELVAEEAISRDGVAHFIAYYDGDEIELTNDLFAYRIN